MTHDPLSLRSPPNTGRGDGGCRHLSFLAFVYSLVIVAQILLGVIVAVGLSVGLYLSYRLFAALDALADAAQRIADTRAREADEASQSSARITERER